MSRENTEVIQQGFAVVARKDWAGLRELISEDCVVSDYDIPDAEAYRGPVGFVDWIAQWDSAWETWSMHDVSLRDVGDERVLATFRMEATGKGSGLEMSREDAIVYTLRQGKIVRVEYYNDQKQARKALGLPE